MQTIPEQISSATRAPIEAQLELFGSIAAATVENTGRLALFQIDAGRAALEQVLAAWRQLLGEAPHSAFERAEARSGMSDADTPRAEAQASAPAHEEAPAEAEPLVAGPHAPQPPAHRTPIAEAAFQVVAHGQPGAPIAAAPTSAQDPVTLPRLKPLEAAPPPPSLAPDGNQRRGAPRK